MRVAKPVQTTAQEWRLRGEVACAMPTALTQETRTLDCARDGPCGQRKRYSDDSDEDAQCRNGHAIKQTRVMLRCADHIACSRAFILEKEGNGTGGMRVRIGRHRRNMPNQRALHREYGCQNDDGDA